MKSIKAELDQAKAAGDESVLLRGFEQASTRSPCMRDEAERNIVAAHKSLEQHRAKVEDIGSNDGTFWNICTDKRQPRRYMEQKLRNL